jgi:hypothetical protein
MTVIMEQAGNRGASSAPIKKRRTMTPGGFFVAAIKVTMADQIMQEMPRSLPTGSFCRRKLDGYSLSDAMEVGFISNMFMFLVDMHETTYLTR